MGHVPRETPDFAALHDYRDANMYVLNAEGAFDPEVVAHFVVDLGDGEVDNDAMWSFYGMAQDRLDAWVKTGALRAVVLKPGALATLQREAEERAIRNAPYPYLAG